MSDNPDDVKDRVAQRFNTKTDENDADATGAARDEQSTDTDQPKQQPQTDTENTATETNELPAWNDQNAKNAQNVKKAWNAITVYLPDDIQRDYSTAYKRLDLELTDETDFILKKTRHYNPLIIELGMERLERMELHEITERMEQFEPHQ